MIKQDMTKLYFARSWIWLGEWRVWTPIRTFLCSGKIRFLQTKSRGWSSGVINKLRKTKWWALDWFDYMGSRNHDAIDIELLDGLVRQDQTPPYYEAESLSWYSRERTKQAWTPSSAQSRWITAVSSVDITPSSVEPARENSWRASFCRQTQHLRLMSIWCTAHQFRVRLDAA